MGDNQFIKSQKSRVRIKITENRLIDTENMLMVARWDGGREDG